MHNTILLRTLSLFSMSNTEMFIWIQHTNIDLIERSAS